MDRETNRSIVSYREELRSLYHKWNHQKKSGAEHLPREYDESAIDRIRQILNEESLKLQAIRECCDEMIKEIDNLEIIRDVRQKSRNTQQ